MIIIRISIPFIRIIPSAICFCQFLYPVVEQEFFFAAAKVKIY